MTAGSGSGPVVDRTGSSEVGESCERKSGKGSGDNNKCSRSDRRVSAGVLEARAGY